VHSSRLSSPCYEFCAVTITYSGIKIYNSFPTNILNLKNERKHLKNELYRYFLNNSFYSVKELLEFSGGN